MDWNDTPMLPFFELEQVFNWFIYIIPKIEHILFKINKQIVVG